jgi:hypothetical protein
MKSFTGLISASVLVAFVSAQGSAATVKPGDLITPGNAALVADLVSPGNFVLVTSRACA